MTHINDITPQMKDLLSALDLGTLIAEITPVYGGLLHKSYNVNTTKGHYFIKALNPHIMQRPTVLDHYALADAISVQAFKEGIPACTVKEIDGKTIHQVDGQYYQVFDWIEKAMDYTHQPENLDACHKIGATLGKLHQIDFSSLPMDEHRDDAPNVTDWEYLISQCNDDAMIRRLSALDIPYVALSQRRCHEANPLLHRQVMSHRDLDPKNVMWDDKKNPIFIDWEAAGPINPTFEMIEVAIYWSEYSDATINRDAFAEVIKGYQQECPIHHDDLSAVWDALATNKIGWIEYNLKRAVGIESSSSDERDMGFQQVQETIQAMKQLDAQLMDLKAIF